MFDIITGSLVISLLHAVIPNHWLLKSYDRDFFKFSDNFLRMTFPAAEQVTPQVTPQIEQLISVIAGEINRQEIQNKLNLYDRINFMNNYLKPAIEHGLIEMTIPDRPNSRFKNIA